MLLGFSIDLASPVNILTRRTKYPKTALIADILRGLRFRGDKTRLGLFAGKKSPPRMGIIQGKLIEGYG